MVEPSDILPGEWDEMPDDAAIILQKSDVESLLTCLLQIQLGVINTQGSIKAIKEGNDQLAIQSWEKTKDIILATSKMISNLYMQITRRPLEKGND